jgi:two-component sensor histidine kinase
MACFCGGWKCSNKEKNINIDPSVAEVKSASNSPRAQIINVLIEGMGPYAWKRNYDSLNVVFLKHDQTRHLGISFHATGFALGEPMEFSWKLEGYSNDWSVLPNQLFDEGVGRVEFYDFLDPGNYTFIVRVRKQGEDWRKPETRLFINVAPALWTLWWFWASLIGAIGLLVYIVGNLRVHAVRKQERLKAAHEKELLEMEARALRAQMNPHFIFNCMNSIKALIQTDDKQKATDYLTTFSKLIRTLFQNSDKRQISLYDELETCRLYTQLEAMRLNGKLKYNFTIDPNVDLKSLMVPALIIQPFIENAIWHGIVPKEQGTINIIVKQNEDAIVCEVDDDGIGREMSQLNKPATPVIHESKGVHLSRLNLKKMLNETNASIEKIDRYDNTQPAGTKVIITFNIQ